MRGLRSIPRPLLLTLAILFALPLVFYTAVWIYYAGWSPPVQIGIEPEREIAPYVAIKRVFPGGPADRAGLRAQDRMATHSMAWRLRRLLPAASPATWCPSLSKGQACKIPLR